LRCGHKARSRFISTVTLSRAAARAGDRVAGVPSGRQQAVPRHLALRGPRAGQGHALGAVRVGGGPPQAGARRARLAGRPALPVPVLRAVLSAARAAGRRGRAAVCAAWAWARLVHTFLHGWRFLWRVPGSRLCLHAWGRSARLRAWGRGTCKRMVRVGSAQFRAGAEAAGARYLPRGCAAALRASPNSEERGKRAAVSRGAGGCGRGARRKRCVRERVSERAAVCQGAAACISGECACTVARAGEGGGGRTRAPSSGHMRAGALRAGRPGFFVSARAALSRCGRRAEREQMGGLVRPRHSARRRAAGMGCI